MLVRISVETVSLVGFLGKSLDNTNSVERVSEYGVKRGGTAIKLCIHSLKLGQHELEHQDNKRYRYENYKRKLPVHHKEEYRKTDEIDSVYYKIRNTVNKESADSVGVVVDSL